MGESSSESSPILNLPLVDISILSLRRTESSIEDCPISEKDAPMEELLKRLRLLVNSRPSDSMRSHLPVPLKKEVNNIIDLLKGRIATADKKEEGTEAETQSNSSQVLSLPHSLEEANPHKSVVKPGQNELEATRSQMKLSYAEAEKLNNKRKKPTLLLYPSEENDKEIEEILTEEFKVDSTNFRFKNVRKIQNKGLAIVWDKHQQLEKLRETILSNDILKKYFFKITWEEIS
ncbi:hypothetical protein AVEN_92903-1 [Araneus ventricosus]|uniref:Uncharacterized protein n=1 Tax=Araneus ventricosus TaxID=182803 RepID=A0A4Y2D079_ARAVE|nr:hypothetical protein AVEN_92903-1 [Araneus ventricosus]